MSNSYFIKITDQDNTYIHYASEDKINTTYEVKKGLIGAAIWKRVPGEKFIKFCLPAKNLKLIPVNEALKVNHDVKIDR